MEASDRSIVGVFRDHAQADLAVDGLMQAGFREDQVRSTVYGPSVTEGEHAEEQHSHEASRTVVTVDAVGREPEDLSILVHHGANNGDLPPGMALEHGVLVKAQPTEHIPQQGVEVGTTPYTFFEEVKDPGHPEDISTMDNINYPHG